MSLFNLFRRTEATPTTNNKPDLDSTFFSMKVKQLPRNFAQSVIDLEMKLEFAESYEIETVQELNNLYRLAVQYYIHGDPKKAKHFQRKLTHLLSNPQTLSLIDEYQQKPKQQHYEKILRSEIGHFNAESNTLVAQMIQVHDRKIQKTGRMVSQQLRDQQSSLRSRLEHRSSSRQGKNGNKRAFLSP